MAVSAAKGFALEVVHIVYVDDANDLVAALASNIFYHVAHFTVANQCYFHCCEFYTYNVITCKSNDL